MKKNVVITGSSGNLGQPTVNRFLNEGWHVFAIVNPGSTVNFEAHNNLEVVELDVLNVNHCSGFIQSLNDANTTIDAMVLLVGGFTSGKLEETTNDQFSKMIALNFFSALNFIRPVVTAHSEKRCNIIIIGSALAIQPEEAGDAVAYALSKALLLHAGEILNKSNNAVNIYPHILSTLDTPHNRKNMPQENFSKWILPETAAEEIFHKATTSTEDFTNEIINTHKK